MSKYLSKAAIMAAPDVLQEEVSVPEWGGAVLVRGMTGVERDAFEASLIQMRGKSRQIDARNLRAKLIALTVIDENGERLFTDADAEELGRKSAAALERVYSVAARLSGLSDEDAEELAKN